MKTLGLSGLVFAMVLGQSLGQTPAPHGADDLGQLYSAAVHTFSIVRSGVAIKDAATGIRHPASHLNDAVLAGGSERRDLAGGWYNAGDYGKWTMLHAISVSYLLDLYEWQERREARKHGHGDARLVEEASWGLAWMLKMQDVDGGVRHKVDGGVRHKVDGGTVASLSAVWGLPPERDPNVRVATPATTLDSADFAAVMYQASRFFAARDAGRATQYRRAADAAYAWVLQHPNVRAGDPFYADDDPKEEKLWARCERSVSTREKDAGLVEELGKVKVAEVSRPNPAVLGIYSVATGRGLAVELRKEAREAIVRVAAALAADAAGRRFRVALGKDEYYWDTAERVVHRGALFVMADSLQPSAVFATAARDQMAWMLGNNAVRHSFVTGYGTNPVEHPWHWTYSAYGKVMPGWAVDGPNGYPEGADPALRRLQEKGTPKEECYVDVCSRAGSWASNEGEISEEAGLVFLSGSLAMTK